MLWLEGTPVRDVSALRDLKVEIYGGPSQITNRIGYAVRRLFKRGGDKG
jgi:hypothetical protein